jgi:hypothetical protein
VSSKNVAYGLNLSIIGSVPDWDPQSGTGTPNLEAFEAALAALTVSGHRNAKLIADGDFFLEGTPHIRQSIAFEGTGRSEPTVGGTRSSPGTWLVFPRHVDGIHLHTGLGEEGGADFTTLRADVIGPASRSGGRGVAAGPCPPPSVGKTWPRPTETPPDGTALAGRT